MTQDVTRKRIETKLIIVGYAMSRLDCSYLTATGCSSWRQAYSEASASLGKPPATFKNLRDEFDPFHGNPRKGWHMRPLRPNRQTVLEELHAVSDDALVALVREVLRCNEDDTKEAIDSLARITRVAANVAERLLTGRRAEDFFTANSLGLINVPAERLVDFRNAATGYDFGISDDPKTAIEVKGIKSQRGDILFTDREWTEARIRANDYLLVVVGNLAGTPKATVTRNPRTTLSVSCRYRQALNITWTSNVSVI